MSRREIMKQSAAQEAAQWEGEEQMSQERQSDLSEQVAEMRQRMKELDARQARIETHLVKLMPSAKSAEAQFATIVARRQGAARGDGRAPEEHSGEPQSLQRTSDEDGGRDQGRVSATTPNSSSVFRQDTGDKRQKRTDGRTMPKYGGDEQRGISQGKRGSAGGVEENSGTSQGRSGDSSQGDRGTGTRLPSSLRTPEQVDRYRDNINSLGRVRHGVDGRRDVDTGEATSSRGNKALESSRDADLEEHDHTYERTAHDAVLTGYESKTQRSSAVDEVIKTLWSGASSYKDIADQSSTYLNHKDRANGMEDHLKRSDITTSTEIAKREDLLLKNHVPLSMCKDQSEPLQARGSSHEREVTLHEQGRHRGHEPSR